ncbi:MAG: hypothetical protein LBG11_00415, partial [Bifidobacteriaceae bacterium]|nr:hypothetical protein [Bifidobacteriaceae bacterium]
MSTAVNHAPPAASGPPPRATDQADPAPIGPPPQVTNPTAPAGTGRRPQATDPADPTVPAGDQPERGTQGFVYQQGSLARHTVKAYEGLFTQGNGYVHLRGSFEEGLEDAPQDRLYERRAVSVTTEVSPETLSKTGTYAPAVVGRHPGLGEVVVNLPNPLDIRIAADGERLDMTRSSLESFHRALDMSNGVLRRTVVWRTRSGCALEIRFERFASRADIHLVAQRATIRVLEGFPDVELEAGIDAAVTTNGHRHFHDPVLAESDGELTCAVVTDAGHRACLASRASVAVEGGPGTAQAAGAVEGGPVAARVAVAAEGGPAAAQTAVVSDVPANRRGEKLSNLVDGGVGFGLVFGGLGVWFGDRFAVFEFGSGPDL